MEPPWHIKTNKYIKDLNYKRMRDLTQNFANILWHIFGYAGS